MNLVAGACLLGALVAAGGSIVGYEPSVYVAIAACAAIPSLAGHSLLNWSVRRIPAHVVGLAILGEPVGAAVLQWVFHGEEPPPHAVVGGVVILGSIAVAMGRRRRPGRGSGGVCEPQLPEVGKDARRVASPLRPQDSSH